MNVLDASQIRRLFKPERKTRNMFRRLRTALELCVDVDLKRIVCCDLNAPKKGMFGLSLKYFNYLLFRHFCVYSIKGYDKSWVFVTNFGCISEKWTWIGKFFVVVMIMCN
jgi:hypothetical protein